MTDFQKALFKIIQNLEDVEAVNGVEWKPASLYEAVVGKYYEEKWKRISDGDLHYHQLKQNGYRVYSEEDAAVYVHKVAQKHEWKFKKLYERFFEEHETILEGDVTLVVWGCGVGLDLFAFYDAAMLQQKPELWVQVRHIVLMDIAPWALERAKESAEILFPMAKILKCQVDFTDSNLETIVKEIKLHDISIMPRIHLISNVVDLLVNDDDILTRFFQSFMTFAMDESRKLNDLALIFSPLYGELRRHPQKIREVLDNLKRGTISEAVKDEKTVYLSYRMLNKEWSNESLREPLLKSLCRAISEVLDSVDSSVRNELSRLWKFVYDKEFYRYYSYIRVIHFDYEEEVNKSVFVYLFCPKKDENGCYWRPLVFCPEMFFASVKGDYYRIVDKVVQVCMKETMDKNGELLGERKIAQKLLLMHCHKDTSLFSIAEIFGKKGEQQLSELTLEEDFQKNKSKLFGFNCESLFFLQSHGESFPSLEVLDKSQRKVVYNRYRHYVVRGAAGTGKTLVMLWHGILAYKRTHLPILFLGKTNSLLSINSHRFAAAFTTYNIPLDAVEFMTINECFCDLANPYGKCYGDEEKCRDCNDAVVDKIQSGKMQLNKKYGAILLDEAQNINYALVKALYTITEKAYFGREFYLFGDEQQTLHEKESTRVKDETTNKWSLKHPDRKRHIKSLNGAYRFMNSDLLNLAKWIQANELSDEYDKTSSGYDNSVEQGELWDFRPFKIIEGKTNDADQLIYQCVADLIGKGSLGHETKNAVAVMFKNGSLAGVYGDKTLKALNLPEGWRVYATHKKKYFNEPNKKLPKEIYDEKKEMRRNFRERDRTLHISTIDCMEGHTFSKVLFVIDRVITSEELFTACTRASDMLYVLDLTDEHVYYQKLKHFN